LLDPFTTPFLINAFVIVWLHQSNIVVACAFMTIDPSVQHLFCVNFC
jgi:hypothetical protein